MAFAYSLGAASTLTPIDLVLDLPIYASKALATLCVSKEADAEEECRVWRGATLVPHGLRVQGACRIRAQSLRQQNSAHREQYVRSFFYLRRIISFSLSSFFYFYRTILPSFLSLMHSPFFNFFTLCQVYPGHALASDAPRRGGWLACLSPTHHRRRAS